MQTFPIRGGAAVDPLKRSYTWGYLLLAAVCFLCFFLLFSPWGGVGCDDVFYSSYLSSFLFDGDVDPLNDYYLSNNLYPAIRSTGELLGPKGIVTNQFAIGSAVLWLPFYLPVRAVGWAMNLFASPPLWANDRFSAPYLLAISLATSCYGFLTLVLIYATCAIKARPLVAACSALGVVPASPLLAYDFQYPAMSHTLSAFSVALLCCSPAANANGIAFSRLLTSGRSLSLEERKTIVSRLLESGYKNPSVYSYAVERLGEKDRLPDHLAAVRRLSPHLWAQWIEALPPGDVSEDLRQEAGQAKRRPFPMAYVLYWEQIREAGSRSKTQEWRQLQRLLRFNPFETRALRRSAEIAALKGWDAEAEEPRSRLQRYLAAEVNGFFAIGNRLVPLHKMVFRDHYLPYAMDLAGFYEETRQLVSALALYEKMESLVGDDSLIRQRKAALQERLNVAKRSRDPGK